MKKHTIPSRQIHLDFHTSEVIEDIGKDFSAEEFAQTLADAHVELVTLFSRCHHGNLYYDSRKYPQRVHPHLVHRDMFRQQARACREKGIQVHLYTTICWDARIAREHPEWVAVDAHARQIRRETGTIFEDPGFHTDLCINSPYREFCKEQVADALEGCPVDGILVDAPFVVECCCPRCLDSMLRRGLDPANPEDRKRHAHLVYYEFTREMTEFLRGINPDFAIFFNKGHVGFQDKPVYDCFDYVAVESQPANCGYMDFPVAARYLRTLGLPVAGMTGRFLTGWGDNHSFRNQAALEFETFSALAYGGICNIGDHLPPSGRLDPYMYPVIGRVFAKVKEKEPWCRNVEPMAEIAVFNPEEFYGGAPGKVNPHAEGVCRMLQELAHQYNLVDSQSDYTPYRLLILADNIPVDDALARRLQAFVQQGGALIATGRAGLLPDGSGFALDCLGIVHEGESPYKAGYLLPGSTLGDGLHPTEYAMYLPSQRIRPASAGTQQLAAFVPPLFNNSWQHYTGHLDAPSSGRPEGPAATQNGRCVYFAHPLSLIYHTMGPRWVKHLLENAIRLVMPGRLVAHDGPSTTIVTLNRQPAENRLVLHLMHYVPERRTQKYDIVEDVIPLHDVGISLLVGTKPQSVFLVPQMEPIAFRFTSGTIQFTVPRVDGHQMVEITV